MKTLMKKMMLFLTVFSALGMASCDIDIIFDERDKIVGTWAYEYSDWAKSEYEEYTFKTDGTWSYLYECDEGNRYYRESDYGTYTLSLGHLTLYSRETYNTYSYDVSVYMDELLLKDATNTYRFYKIR